MVNKMVCYDLKGEEEDDCCWEVEDMFDHETIICECENCGDKAQFKLQHYIDEKKEETK